MRYVLVSDLGQARPDIHDRGLHYGDGLFETMLMSAHDIRYWPEHYTRLRDSAERLGITCPDKEWLDDALADYRELPGEHIVKLMLTRGSGGRGLAWPENPEPTVYLLHYPYQQEGADQAVSVTIVADALSLNPRLAGIKHLNRLDYVLATQMLARRGGFNEALLADRQGNLVEGIAHNLFFVADGEIHTPSVADCGVDGVMRRLIIKKLKAEGKQVTIGRYRESDLWQASELFYCNSVRGVRPVLRLDKRILEPGPLSLELQRTFNVFQTA